MREAFKDEEEDASAPASKKPRLDLLDMLSSSTTSVLDILTASGRKLLPTSLSVDQIIKETETESRPGVLDIFDALPKEALAEDKEPALEVDIDTDLLSLAVVQTLTISPHSKVVMEDDSKCFMRLHARVVTDDAGRPLQIHWMRCRDCLHLACALEIAKMMVLDVKHAINCG